MKLSKFSFVIAALSASFLLIGYSCTSGQYDLEEDLSELNLKPVATTRSIEGSSRMLLIDSISESDEFLDYMLAVKALFKKSDDYFSSLSKKERTALETTASLNNIEENKGAAGYSELCELLKDEMNAVVSTAKVLRKNTDYLKLDNNELNVLFSGQFFVFGDKLRKTKAPEEVLQKCASKRDEKYRQADEEAARAMGDCANLQDDYDYAQCMGDVIVGRNKKWDRADEVYKDCIKG